MIERAIINGTSTPCEALPTGVYVYQRMRTKGYRIASSERYFDHLLRAAAHLFIKPTNVRGEQIAELASRLLREGNYSTSLVHVIELRLYTDGDYTLHVVETSPYDEFALRLTRPDAISVVSQSDLLCVPSSAEVAQNDLLRHYARAKGASIAITHHSDGRVISVDGAAPIAVHSDEVIISPTIESVETEWAIAALKRRRAGKVTMRSLQIDEISTLDELFYADARGLTAVGSYEGHIFANTIAYTTAQDIEKMIK